MKKEEAGARIRTADLLITKAKRTTIEMPVLAGLLFFAQQLTSFRFRRFEPIRAIFDRQVTPELTPGFAGALKRMTEEGIYNIEHGSSHGNHKELVGKYVGDNAGADGARR